MKQMKKKKRNLPDVLDRGKTQNACLLMARHRYGRVNILSTVGDEMVQERCWNPMFSYYTIKTWGEYIVLISTALHTHTAKNLQNGTNVWHFLTEVAQY